MYSAVKSAIILPSRPVRSQPIRKVTQRKVITAHRAYQSNLIDDTLRCQECDYTTKSTNGLKEHQKKHKKQGRQVSSCLSIVSDTVTCKECDFTSTSTRGLTQHQRTHKKVFSCGKCIFKGQTQKAIDIHITSKHKEYKCDECPSMCPTKAKLAAHQKSHAKFECNSCDYQGRTKASLTRHQKLHVPQVAPPALEKQGMLMLITLSCTYITLR